MKRIIRNITGILLLSFAIIATQIPVERMEAAGSDSDFQLDGTTLVKYTGTVSAVSVPDEVKKISAEAFAGNTAITSVRFPKGLESIGYGAFYSCTALKSIQIPDSVVSIGSGVFANCTALNTVSFGSGVKELGTGIFAGCTSLKNVKITKKNVKFKVDKGVIYDTDLTTIYQYLPGKEESSFKVPDSVREIKKYAFWGCKNLESVSLNSDMTVISGYAFSNCQSLQEIQIPYSVKAIGVKAFEDCVGLTELELPISLKEIHDTAFDGCINLTLSGAQGSVSGTYAQAFNQREKPVQAEYEDIQNTVNPPQSVPSSPEEPDPEPEQDVAEDVGNLLGSSVIVGNQAVVFIDNSASSKDGAAAVIPEEDSETVEKGIYMPKYTWTEKGIIADQAYYRKTDMTSFSFPGGTTEIGDFAFARSGLTSVTIPEGVTRIGYGAFYHCDALNQVSLPSTIIEIEPEAFEKTGFIENWKKSGSSSFLTAGDGILLAYNGTEANITLPDGVKMIAPNVFKGHSEIASVVLPDSLVTVGEGAFENCSALKQVSGGANLQFIKDRAFAGCPLDTVRIPDQVKEVGLAAFDFTGVSKRDDSKTVMFHGNIPAVSHERTAQRLSNQEYRKRAFEQVLFAVIDKNISTDALAGSVLDSRAYGFKGIIISIDSDTDMTASVRGTTLTGEELSHFEIPQTVEIYGRQYTLSGSEQLENLAAANTDSAYHNEGSVLILNRVADMDTNQIQASLSENTGSFYLEISKSGDALTRLSEAYRSLFNKDVPADMKAFELSLVDETSGVSITKLGKQSLRVTMPVPAGLENGSLYILCADANGQLENVPYQYEASESGNRVTFETNHFSDFGFYTTGGSLYAQGTIKQGQAVIGSYSVKDDSPDTGDPIHPKWFLAGGLFFGALAVFFYRKKPRVRSL